MAVGDEAPAWRLLLAAWRAVATDHAFHGCKRSAWPPCSYWTGLRTVNGNVYDRNSGVTIGYYNSSDMPWLHFVDWTITTTDNCVYADMTERYYRYKWW